MAAAASRTCPTTACAGGRLCLSPGGGAPPDLSLSCPALTPGGTQKPLLPRPQGPQVTGGTRPLPLVPAEGGQSAQTWGKLVGAGVQSRASDCADGVSEPGRWARTARLPTHLDCAASEQPDPAVSWRNPKFLQNPKTLVSVHHGFEVRTTRPWQIALTGLTSAVLAGL